MDHVRAIVHNEEVYVSGKDLCRALKVLSLRAEYASPSATKLINSIVLSVGSACVDKKANSEG